MRAGAPLLMWITFLTRGERITFCRDTHRPPRVEEAAAAAASAEARSATAEAGAAHAGRPARPAARHAHARAARADEHEHAAPPVAATEAGDVDVHLAHAARKHRCMSQQQQHSSGWAARALTAHCKAMCTTGRRQPRLHPKQAGSSSLVHDSRVLSRQRRCAKGKLE